MSALEWNWRWWARGSWLAAGGALVVGLAVLLGAGFCAATLHVPRRIGNAPPHADNVKIRARDQAVLQAWWLRPATSLTSGCVLVLHGIGNSRSGSVGFAPMFLAEGYSALAPDSRAHGVSGGKFITYGLLEKYDAVAWAHWMRGEGCTRIYGLGESLGASILIQAAALEPVFTAIVAEGAYSDLREVAEYRMARMMGPHFFAGALAKFIIFNGMLYARFVDGLDFRRVSPLKSIALTATPILLIHGLADFRTPAVNSQRLAAVNPGRDRLWLVPGADHAAASAIAPVEFHKRVLDWFAEHR